MHDELDARLLRHFASAAEALAADEFAARLTARLEQSRRWSFSPGTLYSVLGTVASGFGTGVLVPWRLKQARLMVAGAAALTLWTAFL